MTVVCDYDGDIMYSNICNRFGKILTTNCTAEQYEIFKAITENYYPDLCIFDYRDN